MTDAALAVLATVTASSITVVGDDGRTAKVARQLGTRTTR